MKTNFLKTAGLLSLIAIAVTTFACSEDEGVSPNPQTGDTQLFAIDTAKVVRMNLVGGNETVLIDKTVNSSSYISNFSIKPDKSKFVFDENQNSGGTLQKRIIVANADGTGENVIFNNSDISVDFLKYCSDGKIIFVTDHSILHTVNEDGTGETTENFSYNFTDISDDREYMANIIGTSTPDMKVRILDMDGDGGFPGGPNSFSIDVPTAVEIGDAKFTSDNKYVIAPFKEGNSLKAVVIEISTKTSETFTLVSDLPSGWMSYALHLSPSSPKAALTITGENYTKSKTYVIDVEAEEISAPFENNDENIFDVYPN